MTQKDFEETKLWLEKVTGMKFRDGEALFNGSTSAMFEKAINEQPSDDDERYVRLVFSDDKCSLFFLDESGYINETMIYQTDRNNAHLCVDIFSHMIHWN